MIWVAIGVTVFGVVLGVWWWAKHSPRSVLGKADFSETIHETMCWAKDGGCLILKDPAIDRGVAFTKRFQNGLSQVHVGLVGAPPSEEKLETFRGKLELLRISAAEGSASSSSEREFKLVFEGVPEPEVCGRVADLALEAVGLAPGDSFIHRFEGSLDMDAVKKYRQKRFGAGLKVG